MDVISRKEARDALLRSGYLLEQRVESLLRARIGYVEANATYPDPTTGKSREFDVFALDARRAGPNELDFLWGALFIECVNNAQPFVVLTTDPLLPFLDHHHMRITGLPVHIPQADGAAEMGLLTDFVGLGLAMK